ncbi:hypothetical protein ACIQGO_27330 [Streptomyces shenzhenensis]|uniref:hypothetical protein n=1 Tax=Streptomyces shenzhenensis TaxID=943815 RepID=UPI003811D804
MPERRIDFKTLFDLVKPLFAMACVLVALEGWPAGASAPTSTAPCEAACLNGRYERPVSADGAPPVHRAGSASTSRTSSPELVFRRTRWFEQWW